MDISTVGNQSLVLKLFSLVLIDSQSPSKELTKEIMIGKQELIRRLEMIETIREWATSNKIEYKLADNYRHGYNDCLTAVLDIIRKQK
jgi:hypothetical protein